MQGHQRYTLSLFRTVYIRNQSDLFEETIQRREVGRQSLFRAVRDIAQIAFKVHSLRNQLLNVLHACLRLEIPLFLQGLLITALFEHKTYQVRNRKLFALSAKHCDEVQKPLYLLTASSGNAGSRCFAQRLKKADLPICGKAPDSRNRGSPDSPFRHIQDTLHGKIIRRIRYRL